MELTQNVDFWTVMASMSVFDMLCVVPLYLAIRSLVSQRLRNLWLLLLAQATIVLYLFFGDQFILSPELISFSFLLIPISIDAYMGTVLWRSEGFFERIDGLAHLTTVTMLIYQHPYARADKNHLGFVAVSALVGFLLGTTARVMEGTVVNKQ